MSIRVEVKRQHSPADEAYWQAFKLDISPDATVAALLDEVNRRGDVIDEQGWPVRHIHWECSCLQGVCGACAMVINGRPMLACEAFLRDLGSTVRIEPLRKFPLVHDLVVDRSGLAINLQKAEVYIDRFEQPKPESYDQRYAAAKCLKCGLCLEVCPNYKGGARFYGATFANDCYLIASKSGSATTRIVKEYGRHFAVGCSKSLSCMDVCPMQIPTLSSIAKLNRTKPGKELR